MRIRDWSSDVCSSDLVDERIGPAGTHYACLGIALQQHTLHQRHGARASGGVCRKGVAPALRDGNPALYGKSKRQAARGSPGHAKRGLCTERRLQRACDSRMHCKAVSSRSEEHTSELQSLMRISYAVFCLKKKNTSCIIQHTRH